MVDQCEESRCVASYRRRTVSVCFGVADEAVFVELSRCSTRASALTDQASDLADSSSRSASVDVWCCCGGLGDLARGCRRLDLLSPDRKALFPS